MSLVTLTKSNSVQVSSTAGGLRHMLLARGRRRASDFAQRCSQHVKNVKRIARNCARCLPRTICSTAPRTPLSEDWPERSRITRRAAGIGLHRTSMDTPLYPLCCSISTGDESNNEWRPYNNRTTRLIATAERLRCKHTTACRQTRSIEGTKHDPMPYCVNRH
jgi:hypothetical protein